MTMELRNGSFYHNGNPFVPVGFNYWPSNAGTEMWTAEKWDAGKIKSDLKAISSHGFNTLRFFPRWPEFQPKPDRVCEKALKRLEFFIEEAQKNNIMLNPGLFVGFMSGGLYVPEWVGGYFERGNWFNGKNVFKDPEIIKAEMFFIRKIASVFKKYDNLLAYDFGNEINVWQHRYPDCSMDDLANWQKQMTDTLKKEHPGCLVVNGTQMDTVINDSPWRLDRQPVDFFSMHGYPVTGWNHVKFNSLTEPEATMVIPFYVEMAKAWGKPVLLQEFGLALPVDGEIAASHVRATAISSMLAESMGCLMWAWQDFEVENYPYDRNPFEQSLGFVQTNGKVKDSSKGLLEALPALKKYSTWKRSKPEVGILITDDYFRGDATMKYNVSYFYYHYMLTRCHIEHEFCTKFDDSYKCMIIPGPGLRIPRISECEKYLRQGGKVISSGVEWSFWSRGWNELCGIQPVDMLIKKETMDFKIGNWSMEIKLDPGYDYIPLLKSTGGVILHSDKNSKIPLLVKNKVGKGEITCAVPQWEYYLAENKAKKNCELAMSHLMASCGIKSRIKCDNPDIQLAILNNPANGKQVIGAVNHSFKNAKSAIEYNDWKHQVSLKPKGFQIIEL